MGVSIPEQVLFRDLDGESVLLHLGSGQYFGLDEVGTLIWHFLKEGRSMKQIEDRILSEYDVSAEEVRRDVLRIIEELAQNGLLEFKDSEPDNSPADE